MNLKRNFLVNAEVETRDPRFLELFSRAIAKIPVDAPPLRTVGNVTLKKRGNMPGLVGLTQWAELSHGKGLSPIDKRTNTGTQTITFYTELLGQLSDEASIGVVAHEIAHAWLNEHVAPEESAAREREADELAQRWGFGKELAALEMETDPV